MSCKHLSRLTETYEKWGTSIDTRRILSAAQAATQPVPQALSLNYDNLFGIQRVRNPFSLRPVSYSMLSSYLECPWCTHLQKRKKRPKEAEHFTSLQQGRLFGGSHPDPRLVGTLLHTCINFLHTTDGPIPKDLQAQLLLDTNAFTHFIQHDLLTALQKTGKINLAQFFNELSQRPTLFQSSIIAPLQTYQRELVATNSIVFAAAERFQCKLLSTRLTFPDHPDRGGYVGLVGEFDQIRLRRYKRNGRVEQVPAIIEFKKGLGGKTANKTPKNSLFDELSEEEDANESASEPQPTIAHAMQLMVYWLAFQTRWDTSDQVYANKGVLQYIPMPLQQNLELILYNLNDGTQYQLCPTNHQTALMALIECIFYLDWALKSGYTAASPNHSCQRNALTEIPHEAIQVPVGHTSISAHECYQHAHAAFERFKETVRWERYAAK